MMLGFLLARAGVRTVVLEKHADFLRDFRGDTIHPSTLELMYELGILEEFLKRPHQQATELSMQFGDRRFALADLSHLPTHCRFIAFMPQWDFLDFLADNGRRYATFHLKMQTEVVGLLYEGEKVCGVRAQTSEGPLSIRADLVVGTDGRSSTVRVCAGLEVMDIGAPMDVLWMRLSRRASDPSQPLLRFDVGQALVMINRGEHWQCGLVIPKAGFEAVHSRGLGPFRENIARLAPFLRDRVDQLADWSSIKLLTVRVDRLRKWHRPGLLCIGDAAHAMSPVGGVGINLAIQDAVAAANILAAPLRNGTCQSEHLQKVQRRRTPPAYLTQRLQVLLQERLLRGVLSSRPPPALPWIARLMAGVPLLRRVLGYLIGIGIRAEHIQPQANF